MESPETGNLFDRQDASKQTRVFSRTMDVNEYLARELGQPFREYRALLESAVRFKKELPFPVHMDFETSFLCNLRCVMCTHAADAPEGLRPKRPDFLPFELFEKVLDEGRRHTLRSVGLDQEGEPLLNRRIVDYIRCAREKGMLDVMFNSNAMLLTPEKAEALLGSGLTRIHFSLDAFTDATYRGIRIGGDLDRVVRNVLGFLRRRSELALRLPVVRVSFVKMRGNQHELDDFIHFWQDKADYIAVQEYNSPFPTEDSYHGLISSHRDDNPCFRCTQPWFRMVVLSDGSLMPCCILGYSRRLTTGNADVDSVFDVWKSPRVRALRAIHKAGAYWKNPVCAACASNYIPAELLKKADPDPIQLTFPLAKGEEGR